MTATAAHTNIPAEVLAIPLEDINVADARILATESYGPYFARLRREADPLL